VKNTSQGSARRRAGIIRGAYTGDLVLYIRRRRRLGPQADRPPGNPGSIAR
jgi:hypothetical protein